MLSFKDKREISEAIRRAESRTRGEIRVHLKKKCRGEVMDEAKKIFLKLGMHRTRHRSAVLIFIALDPRRFAILGDSGIHEKTGASFWSETRDRMTAHFLNGRIKAGILTGIESAGHKLREHFPCEADDKDELSNRVTGS